MDDIPALLPPHLAPPIRTADDLHRQWRAFVGHPGFSRRELWTVCIDRDGRMTERVVIVEDLPTHPPRRTVRNLLETCRILLEGVDGGQIALMLARPGPAVFTHADRAWVRALACEAAKGGVALLPSFVATDVGVMPFDDPMAAAAA